MNEEVIADDEWRRLANRGVYERTPRGPADLSQAIGEELASVVLSEIERLQHEYPLAISWGAGREPELSLRWDGEGKVFWCRVRNGVLIVGNMLKPPKDLEHLDLSAVWKAFGRVGNVESARTVFRTLEEVCRRLQADQV